MSEYTRTSPFLELKPRKVEPIVMASIIIGILVILFVGGIVVLIVGAGIKSSEVKVIGGSLMGASVLMYLVIWLMGYIDKKNNKSKLQRISSTPLIESSVTPLILSMRNMGTSAPKRDSLVTHTSDADFNDQQNAFVTRIPHPQGRRYDVQTEKTGDKIFTFYTVNDKYGRPKRMVEVTQRPTFSSRVIGSIKSRTRRNRKR